MEKEPTSLEEALIEREFVANQERECRLKRRLRSIFVVGFCIGLIEEVLTTLRYLPSVNVGLYVCWLGCVVAYVGVGYLPRTLMRDMDPRWHVERWSESLRNLGPDRGVIQGALLLAAPWIARLAILAFRILDLALTPK